MCRPLLNSESLEVTLNSQYGRDGWYPLCVSCVCATLFVGLVWLGCVWMRERSILISSTCATGELYIKLVCRLTRAACGFTCVAAQASLIQTVQIRTHSAESISHLIHLLSQSFVFCIDYKVKPQINLCPKIDNSFRNKIIVRFCFEITFMFHLKHFISSCWLCLRRQM